MASIAQAPTPGSTRIRKLPRPGDPAPNVADYDEARRAFTWEAARAALDGLPGGRGLNIAHEAVDRHARGARPARPRCAGSAATASGVELTYGELRGATNRFANVLDGLGVGRGERVFALSGRGARALRRRARHAEAPLRRSARCSPPSGPSRSASGMAHRRRPRARDHAATLYRRKVAPIREQLPEPAARAPGRVADDAGECPGTRDLHAAAGGRRRATTRSAPTDPEDLALLHFTSGTTGTPKGAVHVHEAVVAHHATGRLALDLHADDVFWCTADPGWVTGTSYGIIAPLTHGVTSIVDEAEFDAERWYEHPRARAGHRLVHGADRDPHADEARRRASPREHDLSALRFIASVGEPLNPEAVVWGQRGVRPADPRQLVADRDRRDHDRQLRGDRHPARLDGPAAARHRGRRSCGATPTAIVRATPWSRSTPGDGGRAGAAAGLAVDVPRLPRRARSATAQCFAGGWYLTGDLARRDADGYFWFVGRADDVIKSAGPPDRAVRGRERAAWSTRRWPRPA